MKNLINTQVLPIMGTVLILIGAYIYVHTLLQARAANESTQTSGNGLLFAVIGVLFQILAVLAVIADRLSPTAPNSQ